MVRLGRRGATRHGGFRCGTVWNGVAGTARSGNVVPGEVR